MELEDFLRSEFIAAKIEQHFWSNFEELASQSYQWILREESHTKGLLSIQIDKYEKGRNRDTKYEGMIVSGTVTN